VRESESKETLKTERENKKCDEEEGDGNALGGEEDQEGRTERKAVGVTGD
jgi:hypothetical protein